MLLSALKLVLLFEKKKNYPYFLEVPAPLAAITGPRVQPLGQLWKDGCAPLADYSTDCDYSSGLPVLGRNRTSQL